MEDIKTYSTYTTSYEPEKLNVEEIRYAVKDYFLDEIVLDNELYIRMRKEIPIKIQFKGKEIEMKYGKVYLTDGDNILDIFGNRGRQEFEERLDKCNNIEYNRREKKIIN